ncbi:MAG TPA: hypothetical protein VJT67_03640 [Longimicrobiaceae bacterium]|nr:hypothetical protein [Longimicrobiaceae bacterium]
MSARRIFILLAPFAISVGWLVVLTIVFRAKPPRPASAPGSRPDRNEDDEQRADQPFDTAWKRWLWRAYVLYHFPVAVPACWLSNDNTCPRWLLLELTPILYSGAIFLLFLRP